MSDRLVIIIPTYNEKDNIRRLLFALCELMPEARIIVVDDNSPDGTAQAVQDFALTHPKVRLLWRQQQEGMASAYIDAFARIIPDDTIDYVATMDADLSHQPADLSRLLAHMNNHDLVIGSRYVPTGRVENWAPWREFISRYGNIYVKWVTRVPIDDLTAGFVVYSREILGKVLGDVKNRHPYAYQTEMKFLAHRAGARIKEVPIIFQERASGKSKLKQSAIFEALFFPWYLKLFK